MVAFVSPAAADDLASRVILLANQSDPDSIRIAEHYAAARAVPAANLIALPMAAGEAISWREFIDTVWSPLLARLVADRWIDAIPMTATDALGRRKYAVHHHRISALVVCRGVPLKIAHDPALFAEVLPFTNRAEFRTNAGAVDAELSLLAFPNYPINAFVPNPLFQNEHPTEYELAQVVKVSRLDGPAVADALALVDHALEAERNGLLGRAYVDLSDRDPVGNAWLENVATQLEDLAFAPVVDREPATMPAGARADAAVLYFGWYTDSLDGPFALPGYRFPPGAIALHIHSYTASTLRSTTHGWTGPLVAHGVTATVGNVNEPYLQFTHRPNLLLRALARGSNWVDASYYALQARSWQAITIGDPLYRPFAVSLDEQWRRLKELPPPLAGYAVLRRMHQLDAAKQRDAATALAISFQHDEPSLAVGVELAARLREDGKPEAAATALGLVSAATAFPPDEWALAAEAARLLVACGRPARAAEVWHVLLADPAIPAELRAAWEAEADRAGNP